MKTTHTLLIAIMAVSAAASAVAQARDDAGTLNDQIAAEYIKRHDRNGDGKVSINEYMNWDSVKTNAPNLVDSARRGFAEIDLNNDGFIDASEIKADLARHRAANPKEESPALLKWYF